jgi:hypothetical protein
MYLEENQPAVQAIATSLKKQLEAAYGSTDLDDLDTPRVLANVLAGYKARAIEPTCKDLEWTVDEFVALTVRRALSYYQKLFDVLVNAGAVSPETRVEAGADVYVHAFERREDRDNGAISRIIVVNTQQENFLFVMSGRRTLRDLHIRQFWPDIQTVIDGTGDFDDDLAGATGRNDLSLIDLAKLGASLMRFSDDVDGNYWPARPSLRYFTSGSLIPRLESAGEGLRFGDFRDRGYVLSAKGIGSSQDCLNVEGVLAHGYGSLCRAMSAMSFAVRMFTGKVE